MAVVGARELQPVNVLGSFVQGMEAGRSTLAQRQEALKANQLAMRQQALDEAIAAGGLESEQGRMRLQRMPGGLDALKSFGAVQEQMGKGVEAQTKGLASRMQFFRQNIPFNPAMAPNWLRSAYADPVVGAELSKMAPLEEAIAAIPQDPAEYLKWMEGSANFADKFTERRVPTATDLLPYDRPQSPEVFAQTIGRATAGAPRTTVPVTVKGEEEEAKAYGKFLQSSYEEVRERANRGRRFLPNLELAARTLERGLQTGFGAEFKKDAAKVLVAFGLSTDEAKDNVENAELFQTVVKNQVLQKLAEQKGPQTDQDALRAEQTVAGLDKTTDVNKFLIAFEKAVTKRDLEQEKFYREWRRKNGTFDGAEDAWLSGPGNKSVFDDPTLKKFVGGESNVPPPPPGMKINTNR